MLLLVACGPKPGAPAHPVDPQRGSGAGSSEVAVPTGDASRTEAQCDKLIAHAVELGAAERPPEQTPSDAERTAMQTQLRTSWSPKCKPMTSRGYECALAAHTLAELAACGG